MYCSRAFSCSNENELLHAWHALPTVGLRPAGTLSGMSTYRIEHHSDDGTTVLGHTDAPAAGQIELSAYAMRLIAKGETGEVVLIDEESGEQVARRSLAVEPEPD